FGSAQTRGNRVLPTLLLSESLRAALQIGDTFVVYPWEVHNPSFLIRMKLSRDPVWQGGRRKHFLTFFYNPEVAEDRCEQKLASCVNLFLARPWFIYPQLDRPSKLLGIHARNAELPLSIT